MAKATVKKVGRKRRMAGWTLLTLGVLVAGVWVASRSNQVSYTQGQSGFWLGQGVLDVSRRDEPNSRILDGWRIDPLQRHSGWSWFAANHALEPHVLSRIDLWLIAGERYKAVKNDLEEYAGHRRLRVALWPIPLLLWTPAALLLRSGVVARRRALKGACVKCGYSLAGLARDASCPECGKGAGTK